MRTNSRLSPLTRSSVENTSCKNPSRSQCMKH
jgi:hypothetical protein